MRSSRAFLAVVLTAAAGAGPVNRGVAIGRDEAWRRDLAMLVDELPRRHPNLFFNIGQAEWERAASDLGDAIPAMSDARVVAGLMRLVASVGDAHTAIPLQPAMAFRCYPIRLRFFADGIFVTLAEGPAVAASGLRLVAIGESNVGQAADAMAALVAHENEPWLHVVVPRLLTTVELLRALGFGQGGQARFVFEDGLGQRFALSMEPLSVAESQRFLARPEPTGENVPLYRRHPEHNYWFDYQPGTATLYLRYSRCAEQPGRPPADFAREIEAAADSLVIEAVVIDLRDNPGGNSALIETLVGGLFSRGLLSRPGRVFGVADQGTFSSAVMHCVHLRQHTPIEFFGEPTGGKPNHFGDVRSFVLPYSQLVVYHSMTFFSLVEGDPASFLPDVAVPLAASDYFAGRDPVLERVLDRPPTAEILAPEMDRMAGIGKPVPFLGRGSDPDADDELLLTWSFGDGTTAVGPAPAPHTWWATGAHTVTLTATDPHGMAATATRMVTVVPHLGTVRRRAGRS